jgi:hypothetical protein
MFSTLTLLAILTRDWKFCFLTKCAVEFPTIHEQQFPPITVECSDLISNCAQSTFQSIPPVVLRSQPSSMCCVDRSDHHLGVRSAIFEFFASFSDTLHSHYVITEQKHVSPTNSESHTYFAGTIPRCVTIAHQLILWLTLVPSAAC